jgi:hypothetical protein
LRKARGKREEARGKREEARGKREEGRGKRQRGNKRVYLTLRLLLKPNLKLLQFIKINQFGFEQLTR